MRSIFRILTSTILIISIMILVIPLNVNAGTVYISNEIPYDEGYIIIGESHVVLACDAFSRETDENNHVKGLTGVDYCMKLDDSLYVDDNGLGNTFAMTGNLFFVFEGNKVAEGELQKSKEYIYSNGKGSRGKGVTKIQNVMKTNPNIKHWNIISYQGAVSALNGKEGAQYYIDSYNNWIKEEFPFASIYFVSHSTMTKFYKQNRSSYQFDDAIKDAFPNQYFDMTQFYKDRYPQEMLDPNMSPDTIHWNHATYVELFKYVISEIQKTTPDEKLKALNQKLAFWDTGSYFYSHTLI